MNTPKKFYNLAEAAEFLGLEVSKQDIAILAAESLPVCFHYRGNLGLFKKGMFDLPTAEKPSSPPTKQDIVHHGFDGYLRSLERVSLSRKSEYVTEDEIVPIVEDENRARMVNVADHMNRRPTPPALRTGQCFVRLDNSGMPVSTRIPKSDWLFHRDDLQVEKDGGPSGTKANSAPHETPAERKKRIVKYVNATATQGKTKKVAFVEAAAIDKCGVENIKRIYYGKDAKAKCKANK